VASIVVSCISLGDDPIHFSSIGLSIANGVGAFLILAIAAHLLASFEQGL
jgi:hypothetical protein